MTPTNKFTDKPLPSSEEAERAILGGIILDNRLMSQAIGKISTETFYSPINRRVFAAMVLLFEKQKPIDPILIGEELKKNGSIESVGGVAAITNLTFGLPVCSDLTEYIRILAEKKKVRDLARLGQQIQTMSLDDDADIVEISTVLSKAAEICLDDRYESEPLGLSLGDLLDKEMPDRVEMIRGLGRGENGIINGGTNAGKTTIVRNVTIAKAVGRSFEPLVKTGDPCRVAYFDFEDTEVYSRSDFRTMFGFLSPSEVVRAKENIRIYCDVSIGDEPLQFSNPSHFMIIVEELKKFMPDLIIIDTLGKAFVINDENNNAEIKEKVMRPLKRLAGLTNSAVLALHHIGKAKAEDGAARDAAHRGRGASSFADQSRVIYNIEKDPITETILISCAKIKGPKVDDRRMKLDTPTRWFSPTGEIHVPLVYELLINLFEDERTMTTAEVVQALKGKASERTIKENLKEAMGIGDLVRVKHGLYQKAVDLLPMGESAESADRI